MGWLSRRLFGISEEEATFERRGFHGEDEAVRLRFEKIARSFLVGYHGALEEPRAERLVPRLQDVESDFLGFTYEGVGMGLALLDAVAPGRAWRLSAFLADAGDDHIYMAKVGAGWAMARLPFGKMGVFERLDPLLRWLAFDGYGFHQGFFYWPRSVKGPQEVPKWIRGYARRAFDQGLGRSLWFVDAAVVERIPRTIAGFPESRHADLWSGIGLACTYAGGVDREAVESLREAGSAFAGELAQGAAFAAKARIRAGNSMPHVDLGCELLCGCSAEEAAGATDVTLEGLPSDGEVPAFEIWRRRVAEHLA